MAITKEIINDKIEIVTNFKHVQCRKATIIKEDGVEISRSHHDRYVLNPSRSVVGLDEDGAPDGTFTHVDTDISGESQEVQDICNAVWTDAVKAAWKTHCETIAAGP
jgi:hypothetical protein